MDQLELFPKEPISTTSVNYAVADTLHFTFNTPVVAGYWWPVQNTSIGVSKLPNKFHQWMMRLVFGWKFTKAPSPPKKELLLG